MPVFRSPPPATPAWGPQCSGSPEGPGVSPEPLAGQRATSTSKSSGVGVGWGAHVNHFILPDRLGAQTEPLGMKPRLSTHPLSGKNCSSLSLALRPRWGHPHLVPATPIRAPSPGHTRNAASGPLCTPGPHSPGVHCPALPWLHSRRQEAPGPVCPLARGTLSASLDREAGRAAGLAPLAHPPRRSGHLVTALHLSQ